MKALLVDPLPPSLVETIRGRLPAPHVLDAVTGPGADELARRALDADIFLVLHGRIDAATLALAPRLSFVQRFGVGYDNIDLEAARAAGVSVAYTPGANQDAVAEHTVMLMLALIKRLAFAAGATRRGAWPDQELIALGVPDLGDSVVGLVGFGAAGRAVAARLRPFGCRVLYCTRHPLAPDEEARLGSAYAPLEELLASANVVSAHLPLTPETRGLFGREAFARMPAQSVFVNTARGELVDEDALRDSIASGHLAGAGLDVLRREEAGANPFADLPQVIVTPHYAGATRGAQARILRVGLTNVLRVLAGQRPDYLLVEGRRA